MGPAAPGGASGGSRPVLGVLDMLLGTPALGALTVLSATATGAAAMDAAVGTERILVVTLEAVDLLGAAGSASTAFMARPITQV